ncbi:MAG TPA: phosphotransferase family protein [Thermoanaerobaculia bacterium]|nr:phosphotransferase family protein [Thermoanaerobaculia bacterium]
MRPGEELDLAAVEGWLRQRLPGLAGAAEVTQYAGGASNWTYRLRYPQAQPPLDLVLRRPPAGTKAKSAHDMGREFRIQQALGPVFPYVPRMIGLCEDPALLGASFYVMERIPGAIARRRLPEGCEWTPESARSLCLGVVDRLVELHGVDVGAAGLAGLGKGPGYPRRQIEGWSQRYQQARTWNVPRFHRVCDWLHARIPEDAGRCVIHNDYRLDNLVLAEDEPTRIVGVLDWEMATVGDPLMDLGAALAYWVQADDDPVARRFRRQPTHLPGMLTRREVVERYLAATGRAAVDWPFYEVYGLFRIAVIAQQIYYRYHHRQTRNPAFRSFWLLVHYFHWRCRRLMGRA